MSYLLAGQLSEIERLRLQSRVWEPVGERLLTSLGAGSGQRVLEVGCGVMGWLGAPLRRSCFFQASNRPNANGSAAS